MPEERDRVSRTADVAEVYARRLLSITSGGSGRRETLAVLVDDLEEVGPTTPFRWGSTPLTGRRGGSEVGSRGIMGSQPRGSRVQNTSPATRSSQGRVVGRGMSRGSGSVLPDWYPRVPLQDITEIVRAIERRRARMREGEIFLDITNQNNGESPDLTPQKKLSNSIGTVEKVVSEELQKLKRTPAAKKEREKKVKTLMSMR